MPRLYRRLPSTCQRFARRHKGCKKRQYTALAEAEALKLQSRLEDLTVWEIEKTNETKKGSKMYVYWMASWREDGKTRNVHLGSSRKMDAESALQKARMMKEEAILC
jgi:hypothetical protein